MKNKDAFKRYTSYGGKTMEKKTKINCSVMSCIFNNQKICDAHEISVGCDRCTSAKCTHETECVSFRIKS